MPLSALTARFSQLGGRFLATPNALVERLASVRGIVFDWDGVFHPGTKSDASAGTFSEADSMGTNLLRYALWRRDGRLPACAIITGEESVVARGFAKREHFDAIYEGVRDKARVMDEFCASRGLRRVDLICVFDDVNDLAMAAGCGCRFLVKRPASPLFEEHVVSNRLADYVTGSAGGACAVREVTELVLGLLGRFDEVLRSRVAFDERYAAYLAARNAVSTQPAQ